MLLTRSEVHQNFSQAEFASIATSLLKKFCVLNISQLRASPFYIRVPPFLRFHISGIPHFSFLIPLFYFSFSDYKELFSRLNVKNDWLAESLMYRDGIVVRTLASHRHMSVQFLGSLLCTESFFFLPGYSGFPLSSKTSIDLISVHC